MFNVPYTLLLVDDDPNICDVLEDMVRRYRLADALRMTAVCSGGQALKAFEEGHIDILMTDVKMPGIDGFDLVRTCATKYRSTLVIAFTGATELSVATTLYHDGVFLLLKKPLLPEPLYRALDLCFAKFDWWHDTLKSHY